MAVAALFEHASSLQTRADLAEDGVCFWRTECEEAETALDLANDGVEFWKESAEEADGNALRIHGLLQEARCQLSACKVELAAATASSDDWHRQFLDCQRSRRELDERLLEAEKRVYEAEAKAKAATTELRTEQQRHESTKRELAKAQETRKPKWLKPYKPEFGEFPDQCDRR